MDRIELKRAIVTGGAGFIGSHIVEKLIAENIEVKIIDNLSTGRIENIPDHASFVCEDIRDIDVLRREFDGYDVVFHMAAFPRIVPSIKDPVTFHDINVTGTINVLQAARETSVKNVVYAASSSCYGEPSEIPTTENAEIRPLNPYAYQKYIGEIYCRMYSEVFNLSTQCMRIFNPYGDRSYHPEMVDAAYSSVVGIFLWRHLHSKKLYVTDDGTQERDFVDVRDVADAFYLAALQKGDGSPINLGVGETMSIVELAKLFGNNYEFIEKRPGEASITLASIKRAKEKLGWQPKRRLADYVAERKS
jgi:UDP-glucose 4-epimerase